MWYQNLTENEKERPEQRQNGQEYDPRSLILTYYRYKGHNPANKSANEAEYCAPRKDTPNKVKHKIRRRQPHRPPS
jgi:hypothetical protein